MPTPSKDFVWEEHGQDGDTSLVLVKKGNPKKDTAIQFPVFSLEDGIKVDPILEIAVAHPGKLLWNAHPDHLRALDSKFLGYAKELGYPVPRLPFVRKTPDGLRYTVMEDSLKQLVAHDRKVLPTRFQEHLDAIRVQVKSARRELILEAMKALDLDPKENNDEIFAELDSLYASIDVAEAVFFEDSDFENRRFANGFSLFASEELRNQGKPFLKEMQRLARENVCPLTYVLEDRNSPRHLRLSILSLLTHNHLSEANFIQSVILLYGIRAGWSMFYCLNHLYKVDRLCFLEGNGESSGIERDAEVEKVYPPIPGDFTTKWDGHRWWYKKNGKTLGNLPLKKIYHAYGALVLAARGKERLTPELQVAARALVGDVATFVGRSYKRLTVGSDPRELEMMDRLYDFGAKLGFEHIK